MSAPLDTPMSLSEQPIVQVRVEPAFNSIFSLILLTQIDSYSGLGDWVLQTDHAMTPAERRRNNIVMDGLCNIVTPHRSWASFRAYLDHLKSLPPEELVEKLFASYARNPKFQAASRAEIEQALKSPETYVAFLHTYLDSVRDETEMEACRYLNDPPSMQQLIVTHLEHMWTRYLAPEWERVLPMLQASADAFEKTDYTRRPFPEASRLITGQDHPDEKWEYFLKNNPRQITYVPSLHSGPYLWKHISRDGLWIIFPARLPEGSESAYPALSRTELLVRLNALADDNRLRILEYIRTHGERKAPEIIEDLDISQSAASRHLTQLTATGFLVERRCDGAKCYDLRSDRIEATVGALAKFLLKP